MTNKLPMILLAQLDDVAVFQTAAFQTSVVVNTDIETTDFDILEQKNQQVGQSGQASYGELNLGLHVNDHATQVLTNRMRLLAAINEQLKCQQQLPINSLHWINQVHGKQVYDVDIMPFSMQPVNADAMTSQQSNLGLAIMTADCVPIVLYQPASGQIAAIHAGWQGLACGVIKTTAERFSATGQIKAWIGVCISQQNYEVGSQVRDQLLTGCVENQLLTPSSINNFDQRYCIATDFSPEIDTNFDFDSNINTDAQVERLHKTVDKIANQPKRVGTNKTKLNLPRLANDQLIAADITVCTDLPVDCSYADNHYYSYRRQTHLQQPATGRMALIIVRSSPNTDITNA